MKQDDPHAFDFLGPDWEEHAKEELARLRLGPRAPNDRPCLRCGVERSPGWHASPYRLGNRRSTRAWYCEDCSRRPYSPDEFARLANRAAASP